MTERIARTLIDHRYAETVARRFKRPFTSIHEHDIEALIDIYLRRGRTETAMVCRSVLDDMRRKRGDGECAPPSKEEK